MKKLFVLSGAALMVTSSLLMAANGGKGAPTFESFDTNNDGVITLAEASSRLVKRFASIDLDKSDSISKAEFEKMKTNKSKRGNSQRGFNKLDADHNGEVSEQEFAAMLEAKKSKQAERDENRPTFASLDVNSDGELSTDEFKSNA